MQDDEDLLREILNLPWARAHPSQSFQEVVQLSLINRKATGLDLGVGEGGMDLPKIAHGLL